MKHTILILFVFAPLLGAAQPDTAFIARLKSLDTMDILKMDTVAVPEDALTEKIRQLRKERGGLTVETLLQIKIMEEQQKDTAHQKDYFNRLLSEISTGRIARLMENCFVNLYRRNFTESEVDALLAFYKTPAGKKMDRDFLFLFVESVKGGEQLLKLYH